jgi:nucleoid-associated protein YgaU
MATANLICKLPFPGQMVTFDFNPSQITMQKTTVQQQRSTAAAGGTSGSILKRVPPPTMILDKITIDGDDVEDKVETLFSWMQPAGGILGQLLGAALSAVTGGAINLATKLPLLIFQWGSGFLFECTLQAATIKYTRFDSSGQPTRAEVTQLKLEQTPSLLNMLPFNPTSGGKPGRRSHIVSAGESLPTIATSSYGAPRHWRAVADANGIDDPFRVRPGQHLYLPNPEELLGSR